MRVQPKPPHVLREAAVARRYVVACGGERAAQHWFVNEVHAEPRRVFARCMAYVVTELIFRLVPQNGEGRNRCLKLLVAEGLEARNRRRGRAEGESQRETEI